ncbi:ParB/RepB/Spo0J family partition protein [Olsenella sp. DNF00959]|uniref:ParB/RepB/Spo0J family partition protein n=1 Tax=Olsenella sp. DNF00959 TaxID=1476999 RepID=UPI0009EC6CBA|nr:ParB/RepB/Spo0J family partition protein [Olsenella sp. DNF00959]
MARKGGLGKGLESLMGGADAEVSAITSSSTLPLSQIKPNKGQPRKKFDQQSLEDLSDSIKKNGVLQPILVRKKGANYEIVAGERRYQAAKLAGLEEIPVSIREISDDEVFQLALIENLQRSDLDPIEEALGYRKLIKDNGFTQEQLGKILSKSRSAIANSLRLLDLPQEVQDMMADGKLTAGHARAILAVAGEEGKLKLAQKVLEQGLSVRQTENLAPLFSGNNETGEKPKRELVPQSFKRAQRQLRLALDTNVKVKRVRNKNKVEIEFADEEELAQLVDRLSGGMEAL